MRVKIKIRHKSPSARRTRRRTCFHDVNAATLVSQSNETADMLVSQANPMGVEFFPDVNSFFCSNKFEWLLATRLGVWKCG